jgi:hypothetical protein
LSGVTAVPGGVTAREVAFFVYGFAEGDEARARAILDGLRAGTENGSVRAVAGRHGVNESNLRYWLGKVREGMMVAAVRVPVVVKQG